MTELNKYTLVAMNHENHTQEELVENRKRAYAASAYASYAATGYAAAAYAYAVARAAAEYADYIEHWLNKYFEETGENREDYEAELKRDGSFREVSQ